MSIILSIIAISISIISLTVSLWDRIARIHIDVYEASPVNHGQSFVLSTSISNYSKIPISITDIKFNYGNIKNCSFASDKITGNREGQAIFTEDFPIYLDGLQSKRVYLVSPVIKDLKIIPNGRIIVIFKTNRRKLKAKCRIRNLTTNIAFHSI